MPIGLFIALFGYLLGSVPTGLLLTKLFSKTRSETRGEPEHRSDEYLSNGGKEARDPDPGRGCPEGSDSHRDCHEISRRAVGPAVRCLDCGCGSQSDCRPHLSHFSGIQRWERGRHRSGHLSAYFAYRRAHRILHLCWNRVEMRYISLGSITCVITIPVLIAFFRSDSQAYFVLSVIIAASCHLPPPVQHLKVVAGNRKQMERIVEPPAPQPSSKFLQGCSSPSFLFSTTVGTALFS